MNDYDLLEKYIKGLLEGVELEDFENRLKSEPELSEQLELLLQIKDYTFEQEKQDVKLQLKNIAAKQRQKKSKTRYIYIYSLIAASVAALIYFSFSGNTNYEQPQIAKTENKDSLNITESQIKDSVPEIAEDNLKTPNNVAIKNTPEKANVKQKQKAKTYYVLDYSKPNNNKYGFVPQATDSFRVAVFLYPATNKKYKRKNDTIFLKGNFNKKLLFYKKKDDDIILMQYNGSTFMIENTNYYKELK